MCADLLHLEKSIKALEKSGIEYLHIDVMDGHFVPNFMLGTDFCRILKSVSHIPLDIHLMIDHPEDKLTWFPFCEGDYVSVHVESTNHPQRVLAAIRDRGAKPMIALNPATPIESVKWILPDIDGVLLMTVNPGYAGQKLLPNMIEKIAKMREYLDENGYENVEIEVDGNVSFENAAKMSKAGANIFVAGSSSVFKDGLTLDESVIMLRNAIKN